GVVDQVTCPEDTRSNTNRLQFISRIVHPTIKERIQFSQTQNEELFIKKFSIKESDIPAGALFMVKNETRSSKGEALYTGRFTVI
ncbi:hypothetical protein MP638_003433, partial [Amoeboaphelidium occidentale]